MAPRASQGVALKAEPGQSGHAQVECLSGQRAEPAWLREQRLAAWEEFERAPAPRYQRGIKGWWFTDLTTVRLDRLRPLIEIGGDPAGRKDALAPGALAGELRFADAELRRRSLEPGLQEQGVYFGDLATAIRERPELVERYLGRLALTEDDRFAAMTAALWGNGVFLYVPAGVQVELPLRCLLGLRSPAAALSWRTLIVAEPGSSVWFYEEQSSSSAGMGSLFSSLAEVYVGEGASVAYAALEEWGHGVPGLGRRRAAVARDGRLRWFASHLGGETVRSETRVDLVGPGARLEAVGMFYAEEHQHIDLNALVVHEAPQTTAEFLLRGAVKDAAHAAFAGTLRVPQASQGTDSHLASHTLTLSERARVDVVPSLEIAANDVRVGHGSAAGKLDEEQVFYLMSRGFSRAEAVRTLVRGFFEPALARLPLRAARDRIERAIEGKMPR